MHERMLPKSSLRCVTGRQETLAQELRVLLDGYSGYVSVEAIEGATRTGRLFCTRSRLGVQPLPELLSPEQLAGELVRLAPDARFDPSLASDAFPGWELRKCEIAGGPAVIAWAASLVRRQNQESA